MRILITGATGLVGSALTGRLVAAGHTVGALSRDPDSALRRLPDLDRAHRWEPGGGPPDPAAWAGVDGVVHLAGEPVAGRWTEAKKQAIDRSRAVGTAKLVGAMLGLERPPSVVVSASAIGYYGDRGDEALTEDSAPGGDFLASVCRSWEDACAPLEGAGIRSVRLRIGLVLDPAGGALGEMLPVARLGLTGPLGSGQQWWSWIHRGDLLALLERALTDAALQGVYNATSPNPVRQRDFALTLGRVLRRPAILPAPAFALKLVLGEFSTEVLTSKRVLPARAQEAGVTWRFEDLEPALRDLLG
jgi:uncharacterized protein (TIGR01777 family)